MWNFSSLTHSKFHVGLGLNISPKNWEGLPTGVNRFPHSTLYGPNLEYPDYTKSVFFWTGRKRPQKTGKDYLPAAKTFPHSTPYGPT